MALKARMMPVTVPSSPSSGEHAGDGAQGVEEALELVDHVAPGVLQALHQDLARTVPVGESRGEQPAERGVLLEGRDDLVVDLVGSRPAARLVCGSSWGSTRRSCSVHSRSRMIAAAVIEHRIIGHISGPPARTISHIQADPKP